MTIADAADRFCRPSGIYLLSHSVGLLPVDAPDRFATDVFQVWQQQPHLAWDRWLAEIERFRTALARLFGHEPAWFCPQTNVSSALTKILGALPTDPGRTQILLSEHAFPSVGFVCAAAGALGYEVDFLPSSADTADPDVWASRLDDRTAVAVVTHVHSNTGELIDAEEICSIARARGVTTVVDVAQSAGVVPIDLRRWDADFVVGTSVKWLCGGPGAAFMWVSPDVAGRCHPVDVGWFSHEEPFEFDIHHFRYAHDARRFWGGTPSVGPVVLARTSIELIADLGVEAIREHNQRLTARLLDGMPEASIVGPLDPARRGGTVVVGGEGAAAFAERLSAASIRVDERATGVRISPHVYNGVEDVDAVLARW